MPYIRTVLATYHYVDHLPAVFCTPIVGFHMDADLGTPIGLAGLFEIPPFFDANVISKMLTGPYGDVALILGIAFFISRACYQVVLSLRSISGSTDRSIEVQRYFEDRSSDGP